jgi:hypothetical protein
MLRGIAAQYATCVAQMRIAVLLVVALPLVARAACEKTRIDFPPACVGESVTAEARFCFAPELGCLGGGVVSGVRAPMPPFTLVALSIEGALGRVPAPTGLPILLLPGEVLVAEVSATPAEVGEGKARLVWVLGADDEDSGEDSGPGGGETCDVDLRVATPACGGAVGACSADTCVAGACVTAPADGPCEDGDACTVGDLCKDGVCAAGPPKVCGGDLCEAPGTCVAGACVGGGPIPCSDGNPCTADACDPAQGCVHHPEDARCDDGDACTTDRCDAAAGCVHEPRNGGACDDGDACTTGDTCAGGRCAGKRLGCDDKVACTEDRCVDGHCTHVPTNVRCDGGECALGTCRPGPGADKRGCVAIPVGEGEDCTDDGHACTDDVCTAGVCLHVPIDMRCATADECRVAVCAPERATADDAGCVDGGMAGEGGVCMEDGDPCSADRCRAGRCAHEPVPQFEACRPIEAPYRRALGLATLARDLADGAEETAPAAGAGRMTEALGARLDRIAGALDGAVAALAGVEGVGQGITPRVAGALAESPVQDRARVAFTRVLRTPAEVRSFLTLVTAARVRAELGQDQTRSLRRRGRALLRGTRTLRTELRRLRGVSRTFAR